MDKLVKISDLFHIEYGNKFDKNKLNISTNGINFVSRTSKNLGVDCKVDSVYGIEPYTEGLITVTLGGTYLLSSFVQLEKFYTAQNVKVLRPKQNMNFKTKVFYCYAIKKNRFRYTSHGREANRTFDNILVPCLDSVPQWVETSEYIDINKKPVVDSSFDLPEFSEFILSDFFQVKSSSDPLMKDLAIGCTRYISSTEYNNGVSNLVDYPPSNKGGTLTVNRGGSVGKTYYQPIDYLATYVDVRILKPKVKFNKYVGLFLTVIIEKEKYRFNFSRKMGTKRLNNLKIKLPAGKDGTPNWQFMEDYIKSLPYSSSI